MDFLRGMEWSPAILTKRTGGVMILGGIPCGRSWKEVASLFPSSVFLKLPIGFSFSSGVWWVVHEGSLAATCGKAAANVYLYIYMNDAFRM